MTILKLVKKIPVVGELLRKNQSRILRMMPRSLVMKLCCPNVDWNKIDDEVNNYLAGNEYGITKEKRSPKVIVSLTSYPARIPRIHYTIISLLRQTVKPDEIVLWLGNEQFPNKNADLPEELLKLQDHGLVIKYYKDIRSYKKLIPSLKEYPDDIIVTADDDIFYDSSILEVLIDSYEQNKTVIHCHRAYEITFDSIGNIRSYNEWNGYIDGNDSVVSYTNFFTGVGSILYPPHVLHDEVTNEQLFLKLCPSADDIWFWAMAVLNGTKICVVKNNVPKLLPNYPMDYEDIIEPDGLCSINVSQNYNDVQIQQVLEYYPLILERLRLTNNRNATYTSGSHQSSFFCILV
jgi:hypothetical protein